MRSEAAWEDATREISTVTKEQTDHTLNGVVIALGVIQLGGVLVAIAAIDDKHFWLFGTHVFHIQAFAHALGDVFTGFLPWYTGAEPADYSAVWALAIAGFLILLGFLYLGPLTLKWIGLWLKGVARKLRTKAAQAPNR